MFAREPLKVARFWALVFLSIAAMVLDHQYQRLGPVRSLLATLVYPVQCLVRWPVTVFTEASDYFQPYQALLKENQALKHQQFLQEGKLQRLLAIESENTRLRSLLRSMPREKEGYLVAEIVQVDPLPDRHCVVLNQGRNRGVFVGQPVIDAEGVVGEVVEVYPFSCRVILLTDSRHAIPVENTRNQVRGIVQGLGNLQEMKLQHILSNPDIQVGDVLMTSGLGGNYAYGYPVGEVKAIEQAPGEPFASFVVKPLAKLESIRQVLLLMPPT